MLYRNKISLIFYGIPTNCNSVNYLLSTQIKYLVFLETDLFIFSFGSAP